MAPSIVAALVSLTLVSCASAHVRVLFNATVNSPVRNANTPTSNGAMSVAGPCGGAATWGRRGNFTIMAGDEMSITVEYNGGHKAATNEFHAAFRCEPDGPTEAQMKKPFALEAANVMTLKSPQTQPAPKATKPNFVDASQGNSGPGQNGYRLVFDVPATAEGKCTVSAMDASRGTEWGGCMDVYVVQPPPPPPPGTPPTAPTPTQPPTSPPPLVLTDMVAGGFRQSQVSCVSSFGGCCCINASFDLILPSAIGSSTFLRATMETNGCPHTPQPFHSETYNLPLTMEDAFTYSTTGFTYPKVGGQPYSASLQAGLVTYVNVADSSPMYCDGFAALVTDQAAELLAAFEAYENGLTMLQSWLAEYSASTVTYEQAVTLNATIANVSSLYGVYWSAYEAATPLAQGFIGNETRVLTLAAQHNATLANSTVVYDQAIEQAANNNESGGDSGGMSGAGKAFLAIFIILLIGGLVFAVLKRDRIKEYFGGRGASKYSSSTNGNVPEISVVPVRPAVVQNASYGKVTPQRPTPPVKPTRPSPAARPTAPPKPQPAARRGAPPPRPAPSLADSSTSI